MYWILFLYVNGRYSTVKQEGMVLYQPLLGCRRSQYQDKIFTYQTEQKTETKTKMLESHICPKLIG